jgi:hypothetical protein
MRNILKAAGQSSYRCLPAKKINPPHFEGKPISHVNIGRACRSSSEALLVKPKFKHIFEFTGADRTRRQEGSKMGGFTSTEELLSRRTVLAGAAATAALAGPAGALVSGRASAQHPVHPRR